MFFETGSPEYYVKFLRNLYEEVKNKNLYFLVDSQTKDLKLYLKKKEKKKKKNFIAGTFMDFARKLVTFTQEIQLI